jgi:hypothetical protein
MHRWSWAVAMACGVGFVGLLVSGPPADAMGSPSSGTAGTTGTAITVKVTPNHALVGGQLVTVSGHGLTSSTAGGVQTWFVIECNAAVQGHMDPDSDAQHCAVTVARAIHPRHDGTFSTPFRVVSGIVGDGYCGTPGHLTCVLAVATVAARGTVAHVTFRAAATASTTTSASRTATRG